MQLKRAAAILLMAIGVANAPFAAVSTAQAAAPMAKSQAPGFYRMMLGDFEITALNDGVVDYPTGDVLPTATPQQIDGFLKQNALTDPVGMSYNAFLVNTGTKLILIDTGSGGKLPDDPLFKGTGRLLTNLRAAGYGPDQVDEVYLTHRGQDHMGGLTIGADRAFPNAIVRAPEAEFGRLLDPEKSKAILAKAQGAPEVKAFLQFTQDLFEPYIRAGKFQAFTGDEVELAPGVRALATPGHTPGHTSYVVESRGARMIIMGDLVLSALQFAEPTLGSKYDARPDAGAEQRIRILGLAADRGDWVAGGHLSFPAIGHVRRQGDGFVFIAPPYAIPR